MEEKLVHTTVLLHESIDGLNVQPGDVYLDGTLGSAGHAVYALQKAVGDLTIVGLDRDAAALKRSEKRLAETSLAQITTAKTRIHLVLSSYRDLDKVLDDLKIPKINRMMLDLGLSSDQFETSGRGFSFKKDEPLLMTFAERLVTSDLTAAYILNNWEESSIADIIYGYGEERYARRIAQKIVAFRQTKKITTTFQLVEIVQSAVPASYRRGKIHPATRTFQALRITVNDELNALKDGLKKGFDRLSGGGRMAVISFHSLEDRIVKHFYKQKSDELVGHILTKKPLVPTDAEKQQNPRSRSAKLRIIEKI